MQKKRDEDAGKALRQAAKTGDAETVGMSSDHGHMAGSDSSY
jgi:hypothetical protein